LIKRTGGDGDEDLMPKNNPLYPNVVSVRATKQWQEKLVELATQQARTPARYLRDLIYHLHGTGGIDLANTDYERSIRFGAVNNGD
jgi:predicted DNA-binding protein